MPALTPPQVIAARRGAVVAAFPNGATVTVNKAQIDAATAAVSTWLDNNVASFNAGVAGTVLAGASGAIQAAVLVVVAEIKYGVTG